MIKDYAHKAPVDIQTLFVDNNNNPITTAVGQVTVQRTDDYQYWNGTNFQIAPFQLSMNKISDANSPGLWEFIFLTALLPRNSYLFIVTDSASNAVNVPQKAKAVVGDQAMRLDEIAAAAVVGKVKRDEVLSTITLSEYDDVDETLAVFDVKDIAESPALAGPVFEKTPQ
jgi:hypothetical protein